MKRALANITIAFGLALIVVGIAVGAPPGVAK
jgi:hypothetical protein